MAARWGGRRRRHDHRPVTACKLDAAKQRNGAFLDGVSFVNASDGGCSAQRLSPHTNGARLDAAAVPPTLASTSTFRARTAGTGSTLNRRTDNVCATWPTRGASIPTDLHHELHASASAMRCTAWRGTACDHYTRTAATLFAPKRRAIHRAPNISGVLPSPCSAASSRLTTTPRGPRAMSAPPPRGNIGFAMACRQRPRFQRPAQGWKRVRGINPIIRTTPRRRTCSRQRSDVNLGVWASIDTATAYIIAVGGTALRRIIVRPRRNSVRFPAEQTRSLQRDRHGDAARRLHPRQHGRILKTVNGGARWQVHNTFSSGQLRSASSRQPITADGGRKRKRSVIRRTINGGQTWTIRAVAAGSGFWDIDAVSTDSRG